MTLSAVLLVSFLAATGTAPAETRDHIRGIMRVAVQNFQESSARRGDYLYVLRSERREFDSHGNPRERRTRVVRQEAEGEFVVSRLIERDGKALTEGERAEHEAEIQKRLAEMRALSPRERQRRAEETRTKARSEEAWIGEFAEALDYRQTGEEVIGGRPALVLECSPRPGYRPRNMRARVFEKTRGRVWVDKAANELVKADAEVFDTVSVGFGFLGKIEKGTRFYLERRRLSDGTWLPTVQSVRFAARILMVKSMNREFTMRYSDYKRRPAPTQSAARQRE